MAEAESSLAANGITNSARKKEDLEVLKSRLCDQFNPKRYRDPMVHQEPAGRESWPQGVTPEMVETWLSKIRASS